MLKSIEKLRESSHLDDNKWTLENGEVISMFGADPKDPNAVNWGEQWRKIADEIEAEIADNVILPFDADGKSWSMEDKTFVDDLGDVYQLYAIAWVTPVHQWYLLDQDKRFFLAKECRHVKPRTVEDVLEDYVVEYQTRHARSEFGAEHFDHVDVHEMVKRCADEIRELVKEGGESC